MKKSELKQIIKEEIKKTLNEKVLLKAINPPLQGEVEQAVGKLEEYLLSIRAIADYNQAEVLAKLVINIINAAKEEERNETPDF